MSRSPKVRIILPPFPPTVVIKGRHYVARGPLEQYKADLMAAALGIERRPVELSQSESSILVPMKIVGEETGVGRRTIGRRMAEQAAA